jgi:hypothetical protein
MINENDNIRNMIGIVRTLKESVPNAPVPSSNNNFTEPEGETQTKRGEKVTFDGINTVGFLTLSGVDESVKNNIINVIGEFLKATGLLLDTVSILAEDNRIIIASDTIKNANFEALASITFDTEQEAPQIGFVNGNMDLTNDTAKLLQSIATSYYDNQVGRNKIITATQNGGNNI